MTKYRNPQTGEIWDSETGQITKPKPAPPPIVASQDPRFTVEGVPIEEGFNLPVQQPQQPQFGPMEKMIGAGETALTLGTGAVGGMLGMPYGAIEGLMQSINTGQFGTPQGVDIVEQQALKRAGGMTYQPRTQAGQEYAQKAIEALAPLSALPPMAPEAGALMAATRQAGQMGRAIPGARTAEKAITPLLEYTKPVTKQAVQTLQRLSETITPNTEYKKLIADQLAAGKTDNRLAQYMLVGTKAKKDPLYNQAIKQGFDEGVIAAIKGASPEDKAAMRRMVATMQRGRENALFAVKNRPTDIVGKTLLERFKQVRNVNNEAATRLDRVAKSLKGRPADFSGPINNFIQNLDDMGISIGDDLKPVFAGSDIEGLQGPQNIITNIVKRLSSGEPGDMPDAYDMHRLKRFIDENVTYGTEGEGLKGRAQSVLKQLRRDVDNVLDENFKRYNEVNTTYSDTISAMDSLQGVAGAKMDLTGPNADKAVGTLLRRLMSNAQSRVNLVDAINEISSTAQKYGGKFKGNIDVQMLLADELDSVFGPVAKSSLAGETAKAVRRGSELATGRRTAYGAGAEALATGAEKLQGINEKNAFEVLNKILKRK